MCSILTVCLDLGKKGENCWWAKPQIGLLTIRLVLDLLIPSAHLAGLFNVPNHVWQKCESEVNLTAERSRKGFMEIVIKLLMAFNCFAELS